ncbi:hypothetical protein [uncultured Winogradskyella sp.]|uniref:hypothetical protein n=1 Tax=uncultured Winogradskyella sp. TaxID=395353 RepID=UPI002610C017|nr:hypothetical protein [uncultured Winogradskyella sp.]
MYKTIVTLSILFFSISVFAKSGKVIVSGKVSNPSATSIKITFFDYKEVTSADLDDDGDFKLSTKIEEGFYFLTYGRNTAYIYLYPKDELYISFDAEHFDETLVFEGKGAARNNYLAKKSAIDEELTKDLEAFYKVDESTYLKNIENLKQVHLKKLEQSTTEDFFKVAERKSIEYQRLLSIQNYANSYKFYLGDEISPSLDFYKPLDKVKLNKEDDYKKQPYYRYLVNSIWSKKIEAAPNADEMLNVLREVPLRDTAITLVNGFYSKISSNKERAKDYLDLIKMVTTHQPFIEAAEKQYNEVMKS